MRRDPFCGLRVKLPPADQSTTHGGGFTLSHFNAQRQVVNINFFGRWFDPTRNRIRAYRFSSRRSFHLPRIGC